jgi:3-oxoacyl-[acyl-carrier protein] reductase
MDLSVREKTILVAASSEGLGLSIARAAYAEGARVWIGSRDGEKVRQAVARLRGEIQDPQRIGGSVLDMTSGPSIQTWVQEAQGAYGKTLDAVVVNSGGPPPGKFLDFDDAAWQGAFELLVLSAVRLIRTCLPGLRVHGGSILIVSSTSVKEPLEGLILSNALRSATVALAKTLSVELAADGIRVNCLAPGRFATGRVERIDQATAQRLGITPQEARQRAESAIPLGRYGQVDEFGRTALWLLSPAASYVTGQLISLDGGMTRGTW